MNGKVVIAEYANGMRSWTTASDIGQLRRTLDKSFSRTLPLRGPGPLTKLVVRDLDMSHRTR